MSKMRPEVTNRRIESFGKRFGQAHLYLACHAAFPLALTPDLLYRLWANFQRDIHAKMLGIPWIAVADLLLSSLCNEVGHELYEMDIAVRKELLKRLKDDPDFGQQRLNELANFLLDYIRQQLHSDDPDVQDLAQTQRWTALAYVQPSQAARELALALSKLNHKQDTAELVRFASLVNTVAEPLAEFEPLLIYTRGMASFVRGDIESAGNQFATLPVENNQIEVAGVSLLIPEQITKVSRQVEVTPVTQIPKSKNQKIKSSILNIFSSLLPSMQTSDTQQVAYASQSSYSRRYHETVAKGWLQTVLVISLGITALILGVRELKWLESWELRAYDQMLRLRPTEAPDPRILLVTVTEDDLRQYRWPVSDSKMNELLAKLESYQPRVIGINIYRPEQTNLGASLKRRDNIVSTCAFSSVGLPEIAPPSNFPIDNVGFIDLISDKDGIVRRSLLFANSPKDKKCTTNFSFAALLAIKYLEKQGIEPDFSDENNFKLVDAHSQKVKASFKILDSNAGGYKSMDDGGYQIMLNYRHPDSLAQEITFSQALKGNINPNWIKDRLVIIGTKSPSLHPGFYTPYNALPNQPARMPAVFIHAQIASQMLSTVLDKRPVIWYFSGSAESMWVWGWSLVGGVLAWRIQHSLFLGLAHGIAIVTLFGLCYVLFLQGGWIPLVPSALALVVTSVSVRVYVEFQPRLVHRQTEESRKNKLPNNNLTKKS
ncbi:serine/threonine protein kinase with Chase2 sensor [Scytonema sp. HK-05]|uniref:CHASE2 domain-containing protein n=1 Tax=Scytonema sp. HK-05 TaxID=1137095 RepID=UPI000936E2C0|nr:CHASE2 domain-containing protein [Scytonema sp. HK-05]OKH54172.1 hypothetical protein NIES2130_29295 [Scytonema sp. HK-05]BAY49131.1 serine/threonine protein kinase with Chase2 sensor [Scytonema sp. HK-05]